MQSLCQATVSPAARCDIVDARSMQDGVDTLQLAAPLEVLAS